MADLIRSGCALVGDVQTGDSSLQRDQLAPRSFQNHHDVSEARTFLFWSNQVTIGGWFAARSTIRVFILFHKLPELVHAGRPQSWLVVGYHNGSARAGIRFTSACLPPSLNFTLIFRQQNGSRGMDWSEEFTL